MARDSRWDRLAASLAAAGIEANVTDSRYAGGTSSRIAIRTATGTVMVSDGWYKDRLWTGWQVWFTDSATDFSTGFGRRMKRKGEVVAAVQAALKEGAA
jgi:hypothetical protein